MFAHKYRPMELAALGDHIDIVQMLIEEFEHPIDKENTILHHALRSKANRVVEYLLATKTPEELNLTRATVG